MLGPAISTGAKALPRLLANSAGVKPPVRAPAYATSRSMSSGADKGPVHGHSGSSVPQDVDVTAAKEGQAQFCGSGQPLDVGEDPRRDDAVQGHSDTSVPADADVQAAKEGTPQDSGSGQALDLNGMTVNEREDAAATAVCD